VIAVTIPTTDVNSESAVVLQWYVDDRGEVAGGEPLVEVETSKSIIDIAAPGPGIVLQAATKGDQVRIDQPLAYLFDTIASLEQFERERAERAERSDEHAGRVTAPARQRAQELAVDIDDVARRTEGLVTRKHVEAFAEEQRPAVREEDLPDPVQARPGVQRLLLIGAGLGATQVLDIIAPDERKQAIAVVDDNPKLHGEAIEGLPVVGGTERGLRLFAAGAFDGAVICVGTSVPARVKLRQACEQAGLPLVNAIDTSTRLLSGVRIGNGNVICANCHFGVGTVIGDNNFISAYNSYDHHSVIGSDIATGPGCMSSGVVKIGDRCRLGTGIFIEPHVELGAGVQVASGAVILGSVPPEHAVKTRIVTTTVVPLTRR
jgi:hypothetical protein